MSKYYSMNKYLKGGVNMDMKSYLLKERYRITTEIKHLKILKIKHDIKRQELDRKLYEITQCYQKEIDYLQNQLEKVEQQKEIELNTYYKALNIMKELKKVLGNEIFQNLCDLLDFKAEIVDTIENENSRENTQQIIELSIQLIHALDEIEKLN